MTNFAKMTHLPRCYQRFDKNLQRDDKNGQLIIIIIIIIITRIFIQDNLSVLIKRTVIKRDL